MIKSLKSIVALALACGWAGCGDDSVDAPPPVEQSGALVGTVGPDGGEIVGLPFTPFEGLVLAIPAGALDAETDITIRVTRDETPLPDDAFAVGRQFSFDPPAPLKVPASITVPVFAEAVASFGKDSVSIKVWLKGPQAWEVVQPDSAGDGQTTIAVDALSTLAAGVWVKELPGVTMACIDDGSCTEKVVTWQPIAADAPPALGRMVARGNDLYYLTVDSSPSGISVRAVRYDTKGRTAVSSKPATLLAGDADRDRGIAIDATGDVWIGTRTGVARLSFDGASEVISAATTPRAVTVFAAGDRVGRVVAVDGALEISYITDAATIEGPMRLDIENPPRHGLPTVGSRLSAVADPSQAGALWLASTHAAGELLHIDTAGGAAVIDRTVSLPAEQWAAGALAALDAGVFAITAPDLALLQSQGDAMTAIDGLARATTVAADDESVWVGLADAPAVVRLDADGKVEAYHLLSDGELERSETRAQVPAAMVALKDGLIVLTRSGELLEMTTGEPQ